MKTCHRKQTECIECEESNANKQEVRGDGNKSETQSEKREREPRRERAEASERAALLPVRHSSFTGFISLQLRWALKLDTPKYPNYTCTSCPFVMGIQLFFPPPLPESLRTQSGQLSSVELRRPAQTIHVCFIGGRQIGCAFNGPNWTLY